MDMCHVVPTFLWTTILKSLVFIVYMFQQNLFQIFFLAIVLWSKRKVFATFPCNFWKMKTLTCVRPARSLQKLLKSAAMCLISKIAKGAKSLHPNPNYLYTVLEWMCTSWVVYNARALQICRIGLLVNFLNPNNSNYVLVEPITY